MALWAYLVGILERKFSKVCAIPDFWKHDMT